MKILRGTRFLRSITLVLTLAFIFGVFSATTVFAAETPESDLVEPTAVKVIYPVSGVSSGNSKTKITLTYNIPAVQAYEISYAYWTEGGAYSNGKLTFRHNGTGKEVVATFNNMPNGGTTFVSLPETGIYTVTLEKYITSSTATFYYAFDLIQHR